MYKRTNTIVAWPKKGLAANHGIFDVAVNEEKKRVYVNNLRTPSILVIDTKTNDFIKQIMFNLEIHTWQGFSAISYNPCNERIYNVSENLKKIFVLDAKEEKFIKSISMDKPPRGVKIDPNSGMIFVTHYGEGSYKESFVSKKREDEMYLKNKYYCSVSVFDKNEEFIKNVEVDWRPWELSIDTKENLTYISCKGRDWNRQGTLCVIDNKSLEVVKRIKVGRKPRGVATNQKFGKAYIACRYDNLVYVVNTKEGSVTNKLYVDNDCIGIVSIPKRDKIYVINREGLKKLGDRYRGEPSTVQIIDCKTDEIGKRLYLGKTGHYGALDNSKNLLYVPCEDSLDLWIIDVENEEVINKVDLGRTMDPHSINHLNGYIYATSHITDELSVIDGRKDRLEKTLSIGGWPERVSIDTKKNRIYVCEEDQGTVSVIDGKSNLIINRYDLNINGQFNFGIPDGAHGGCVPDIAVDLIRSKIYVSCPAHDLLAVIDENRKKVDHIYLGWSEKWGYPRWHMSLVVDEKRNLIYILNPLFGLIKVINGEDNKIIDCIDLPINNQNEVRLIIDTEKDIIYAGSFIIKSRKIIGKIPKKIGTIIKDFDPNKRRVYVLNAKERKINIIDADTYKILDFIELERFVSKNLHIAVDFISNKIYVNHMPLIWPELEIYEKI